MSLVENLENIQKSIPEHVTLVAVSKTQPISAIQTLYDAGQRIFGENKVQEMVAKYEHLPKDIQWHMIGHLQKNKVKYMASFVHLIHSVDSFDLLKEINKQAAKHDRVIDCLLQIHIAQEETKFGMDEQEAESLLEVYKSEFPHVKVVGLMGMATFTEDESQVRKEFNFLKSIFVKLKSRYTDLEVLSMGMSGDFQMAIEEGSTMVRVGSSIFGERIYS
ncbi:YggS family pyridoxal phosphate-dependent enzyme [Moheibacter stercoris]|uniref:Pyridoxal phosphate homeostasis protein n=1 Tax=Moheibacter stercoris TaxID=1628251 RepID=A0ABV2LZJ1_9FLAO